MGLKGIAALSFIAACAVSAETLTVCEALGNLDHLNQKETKIRGTWRIGDTGEYLTSSRVCELPIVRDGWIWRAVLQAMPGNEHAKALSGEYYSLRKKIKEESRESRAYMRIEVTLSGRVETRDHFRTRLGSALPMAFGAFGDFVAIIVYEDVEDATIVPYAPGELERELELARRPEPQRVHRHK